MVDNNTLLENTSDDLNTLNHSEESRRSEKNHFLLKDIPEMQK